MVVNGEVRLNDAIVVGRLVDHGSSEGQRQFELRALSAKTKPGDESNAALIRQKLIEIRARAAARVSRPPESKRHAARPSLLFAKLALQSYQTRHTLKGRLPGGFAEPRRVV
jgi:hypothetical protein